MQFFVKAKQSSWDARVANITQNVFDISDMNQKIYRIFPLKRALALFQENKNVLVRPSLWDDPFENFFLKATGLDSFGNYVGLENIRNSWYGQCWTTTEESDAMWRIYSHKKDGVRLSTTVGKLFNSFNHVTKSYAALEFFIGQVQYVQQNQIARYAKDMNFSDVAIGGDNKNFAKLLLIKRMEFEHEQEIRLLCCDSERQHNEENIVALEFDANSIIDSIMFDPRLELNKVACHAEKFKRTHFRKNITRSKLYEAPRLVISL